MRFADNSFVSDPGDPIHIVYAPKVKPNGEIELVESGRENTNDYIQSFAEQCDIHMIAQRVANGEVDLLTRRTGSYGDFTQMPKTFAEALQLQIDSNRLFESLPLEVRKDFNNDPNQFFAQSGTNEWFDKISPVLPEEVKSMIKPPEATIQPVNPGKDVEK